MLSDLYNLSGSFVTELPLTSEISVDDYLIGSSPLTKNKRNKNFQSVRINEDVIRQDIQDYVLDKLKLGSMAFCDKDEYSKYDHIHPEYSKLCAITQIYEQGPDTSLAFSIINDGNITDIYVPNPLSSETSNVIGEIKFVASKNKYEIDINDVDFDGWVYPDGKSYKLDDFKQSTELKQVFENDGISFKVPNIDQFIRTNSTPYENVTKTQIQSHNVLKEHYHSLNIKPSGTVNVEFKYDISQGYDYPYSGDRSHAGQTSEKGKLDVEIPIRLSITKATPDNGFISTQERIGDESVPSHNLLPILIYIGLKK